MRARRLWVVDCGAKMVERILDTPEIRILNHVILFVRSKTVPYLINAKKERGD